MTDNVSSADGTRTDRTSRDMNDRWRPEDALRASEAKFAKVFHSSSNGMAFTEYDSGIIVDVNATWVRATGIAREEAIGKTALALGLWANPADREACVARLKEEGRLHDVEIPLVMKSTAVPHLFSAEVIELDGKRYAFWEFRDVGKLKQVEDDLRGSEAGLRRLLEESDRSRRALLSMAEDQRAAESALRESEARLRLVLDGLGPQMFVALLDVEGVVLVANRPAIEVARLRPEDVHGKPLPETYWFAYSDAVRQRVRAAIQRAAQGEAVRYDEQGRVAEGRLIWIDFSLRPLRDESGKIVFLVSSASDITERKRVESALWESEERLRALVDNTVLGIAVMDTDYRILTVNPTFAGLFKKSPGDFVGKHCFREFEKREAVCPHCPGTRAMVSCKTEEVETQGVRDDGSRFYVHNRAVPFFWRDGALKGFIEMVEDIDTRKRAEEAVRKSEDRYRASITLTQQLAWTTDADGTVVEDIPHWREFTGQSEEDTRGDGWARAIHPDDRERTLHVWSRAVETKSAYETEYRVRRSDGIYRDFLTRGIPVLKEDGSIREWVGVCIDITDRKRAEDALRSSEEKFRGIAERSFDLIFMTDGQGILTYVSPAVEKLLLFTPEEVVGRHFGEFMAGEDLAPATRALAGCMAGVPTGLLEFRLINKRGIQVIVELTAGPVREHGQVVGAQGIVRDVTDRKRAEVALRESEARYRTLFDAGQDTVFLTGIAADGQPLNFIEANEVACRMFGYTRDELLTMSFRDLSPPEYYEMVPALASTLIADRQFRAEWEHVAKDGRRIPVDVSVTLFELGGQPVTMAVVRDITERKRVEQSLRRSEQLYRSVVENIEAGITVIDSSYTLVAVNAAQARMFGKAPHELVAQKCYREFANRDAPCSQCPGSEAMATGRQADREREGVRDDGSRFAARVRAFPLFGPDGAATGFIELVEDITQRRQTEQFLQRAKEAAEAASRAKSEFLANMSHEIRTPMTAILGYADLLMAPNLSSQEQREFLAGIQRNGRALTELISDILDLSRIEAERLTLEKADCPLRQVIDDVLSVVHVWAGTKGLGLEVDHAFPLPETIHTDPGRLRQVLANLIGNAVKFTERGAVRIAVRCLQAPDRPARIEFAISDTGIGIPPDRIGELFQPFTQLDMSATRCHGGTGLGLAISKRLAKALGGDVEVASELGKGSTFTLTIDAGSLEGVRMLQAHQVPTTAMEQPPATEPEVPLGGRVLLAEDVPDTYVVLRQILQRTNLEVEIAENGRVACEMAEKSQAAGKPYHLILMDVQMPKMNGHEAARWLRQHGWKGPIVALTAHALAGDREKCLAAGCDDYLAKPVTAAGLRDVLVRYLGQAAAGSTSPGAAPGTRESAGLLDSGILDPGEVAALVEAFRTELPTRAERIDTAFQQRDRTELLQLTHQLKGSAGLYGLDDMSETARAICDHLRADGELEELRATVSELVALCRQAASGQPGTPSNKHASL